MPCREAPLAGYFRVCNSAQEAASTTSRFLIFLTKTVLPSGERTRSTGLPLNWSRWPARPSICLVGRDCLPLGNGPTCSFGVASDDGSPATQHAANTASQSRRERRHRHMNVLFIVLHKLPS